MSISSSSVPIVCGHVLGPPPGLTDWELAPAKQRFWWAVRQRRCCRARSATAESQSSSLRSGARSSLVE
eukprot:2457982-Pyramimonas_sp.AAC.1